MVHSDFQIPLFFYVAFTVPHRAYLKISFIVSVLTLLAHSTAQFVKMHPAAVVADWE